MFAVNVNTVLHTNSAEVLPALLVSTLNDTEMKDPSLANTADRIWGALGGWKTEVMVKLFVPRNSTENSELDAPVDVIITGYVPAVATPKKLTDAEVDAEALVKVIDDGWNALGTPVREKVNVTEVVGRVASDTVTALAKPVLTTSDFDATFTDTFLQHAELKGYAFWAKKACRVIRTASEDLVTHVP